jgi:O-6-methylguanine DNA methyltransferase
VLGTLRVWGTTRGIRRLAFESEPDLARVDDDLSEGTPPAHLQDALAELGAYLTGELRAFGSPIDLQGVTPFQLRVYQRLLRIPYGQVVTYGRVAEDIGARAEGAARAVGQAVGANPIPILIPCHRVVGAGRRLTGFGGGPERKAALLAIEGVEVDGVQVSSRVRPEVLRLPL